MPNPSRPGRSARRVLRRAADPRKVGGVYFSNYWQKQYTVTDIPRPGWFTVQWSDGTTTTHCTAWEPRDLIISQPQSE